jgi:hypothetical protein
MLATWHVVEKHGLLPFFFFKPFLDFTTFDDGKKSGKENEEISLINKDFPSLYVAILFFVTMKSVNVTEVW